LTIYDFGFWILDLRFTILDFGFTILEKVVGLAVDSAKPTTFSKIVNPKSKIQNPKS